ncbi:MAG: hypothetical protein KBT20_04350 [Bacteroidales bacterium]|nr:hypothetical protein [Candidatus Liminaster caballi]
MKKFLSLALISAIAAFSFAASPVQKSVKRNTIEVAYRSNALAEKAMYVALQEVKAAKAAASEEFTATAVKAAGNSRVYAKANLTEFGKAIKGAKATRQAFNGPSLKSRVAHEKAAFKVGAAPVRFAAPKKAAQEVLPEFTTVAEDGTQQYLFNLGYGGFMVGANDWGTRASVSRNSGMPIAISKVSGGTYKLGAFSPDNAEGLWIDGSRDGNDKFTFEAAGADTYLIGCTKFPGTVLTWGGDEANTRVNFTADTTNCKWGVVSAEAYAAYWDALEAEGIYTAHMSNDKAAWAGATGVYGGGAERYAEGGCPEGDLMTQTISNLPAGKYLVTFHAIANVARNLDVAQFAGDGIAYAFANDAKVDVTVGTKSGLDAADWDNGLREIECTVGEDGVLAYGIGNYRAGGQWYVVRTVSLIKLPDYIPVEATSVAATYYASDGDWYCVLKDDLNTFVFDIVTNDPAELELDHEYTLADMDPSYSFCRLNGSTSTKIQYASASFVVKQGLYGRDYDVKAVLTNGDAYHVIYTAPRPETIDVEATTATIKWYGQPDNDWFVVLSNANLEFRFDIFDQSADGLLLNHEYTLADMIEDYSWGQNKLTNTQFSYKSVSFKALTGANGTDYVATVVDNVNNTYNVTYTTQAAPEPTSTVEVEFTAAETQLVDASASSGIIQFAGAKENGFEAFVAINTNQIAGTYTFEDIIADYTGLYIDAEDMDGVVCVDLTAVVTDLGNGAYKAVVEYLGANTVLYKLTFNYGEAGAEEVVVTKDAHGIITSVTGGTAKSYARAASGTAYFVNNSQMSMAAQSGTVTVIEDGDKVYIKDPITRYTQGSWVEGTKEGNTIVVAAHQPLAYNSSYDATISLRWGVITATGSINNADSYAENFVFEVAGDTWTLLNTATYDESADAYYMGAFWDDDDTATGYGDAETVLTYDPNFEPVSTELVTPPSSLVAEDWALEATQISSSGETSVTARVKVGFAGNDVYVQGLIKDFPTSWVKGTMDANGLVTFKKFQFVGVYGGTYNIWMIGVTEDGEEAYMDDFQMQYDAADNAFYAINECLANAAEDRIYYLGWYSGIVLTKGALEEPVITDLTAALPYVNGFDTDAEQAEAAIFDANDDGKTFTLTNDTNTGSTAARYAYSSANSGNDYVVFPGLSLTAGTSYKVSVDARAYSSSYPERIEVVAGKVAKASKLSISVIPATDLVSTDYETLTAEFVPDSTGVYYFAIHAISDPDMYYLFADNFSVKENNMSAPTAPADLAVTPDQNADLKASIQFYAPMTTLGGDTITETISFVVKRDGEVISDDLTAAAGALVELQDNNVPTPGSHTYSVVAVLNDVASDPVSAKVYVGEDTPDDVQNIAAADCNETVLLTWDAPTEGYNGGIIKPENVRYNVYPVEMVEFFGMQFPSMDTDNPYATELTDTKYDVAFDTNTGAQQYSYFGVTASNEAGESGGVLAALLTGAPYEMPLVEGLAGGSLAYWWGLDYDEANEALEGGLYIGEESSDEDGYSFLFAAETVGYIDLLSGKIAMNGAANAAISFDYKSDAAATLTVIAVTAEGEKALKTIDVAASESWSTAKVSLADFANEKWVRLTLHGEFTGKTELYVDNIVVMDMISDNLVLSLNAPKSVVAGKTAAVKVTVKNQGENVAEGYVIKVTADDEVVAEFTDNAALGFMEAVTVTANVETTVFTEAGDITVKAEVLFDADLKAEDNADEAVVAVVAPSVTPVENVTAVLAENGVEVAWTVATESATEVVEDFESYEAGSMYADGTTMGEWGAIDLVQGSTYGWESSQIAWDNTGVPYAFAIMNFNIVFAAGTDIQAVSGEQALMFMSEVDANTGSGVQSDKYLVSPELPGCAQTISFSAIPMTTQYGPELLEVMVSTTDNNVTSFTKVAEFSFDTEEWGEFSANLPEGAKYFALHYVSNDVFALFIDDLKYTVGGATPTGFNVYVDEALVASCAADAVSYTYTETLAAGVHMVSVTALYGSNESAPVTVEIGTDAITSVEAIAADAVIFNLQGQLVKAAEVEPGVYVINGVKTFVK